MTYAKLLVATDLSEESKAGVRAAVELAQFGEAPSELTLLHVIDLSELFPSFPVFLTPDRREDIENEVRGRVVQTLEQLRADLVPAKVPSTVVVEESATVAQAICDYAKTRGFDAVVIGTHGRSGVTEALLGSVAERVLRHSSVPVLVVPVKD